MENSDAMVRREERRRRIVERGSDRMAFITGQLRHINNASTPPPSPSVYTHRHRYHDDQHDVNDGLEIDDHAITKKILEQSDSNIQTTGREIEAHEDDKNELSMPKLQQLRRQRPRFFRSKHLNSCIVSTENTRIFCALIIALMVVLSHVDYPGLGKMFARSRSIVASRPLLILMVTDVTIVIARLYLENQNALKEEEEEGIEKEVVQFQIDSQSWIEAVKVMERGLVIYQAVRGLFLDCGVYAVVLVCGLPLV